MLRKIRCHIKPCIHQNNNYNSVSFSPVSKHPSLIVLDLDDREIPLKPVPLTYAQRSINLGTSIEEITLNKKNLSSRSQKLLVKFDSNSIRVTSSTSSNSGHQCLSGFNESTRKCKSDSIMHTHQYASTNTISHFRFIMPKQRAQSNCSSESINSMTDDTSSWLPSSTTNSDISNVSHKNLDKRWRLKIQDTLNKDGSRHYVIRKGNEETMRERRQKKQAKRSEEKKRKIEENIDKANQRWQKYSNIDYELIFFISRYYDQLPLCSNCRSYFTTYQTRILADDPRASMDYAADDILQSPNNKTMTMKKAAKARLIRDYDKQTSIIFNLCDTCLSTCEQIRNELKHIRYANRPYDELNSPNTDLMTTIAHNSQEQHTVVSSPINDFYFNDGSFSPIDSPLVSPIPLNTDSFHNHDINLIQCHQKKLQELYQQSQNILSIQQYPENYSLAHDQQRLNYELDSCLKQMQYHCLQLVYLQYPRHSLSYPYEPSYDPRHLSYWNDENNHESFQTKTFSSEHVRQTSNKRNRNLQQEDNIGHYDAYLKATDDRLTIEACHELIEYCNSPLDNFIRGVEVLKCLGNLYQSAC